MRLFLVGLTIVASIVTASAQQQPIPLSDWRASLDTDLSKLSMPRDAHAAVFNILQAYERQAQMEKMRQIPPVEPPK